MIIHGASPNLGKCCACEGNEKVLTIFMLDRRSPEPGVGCWGCLQCGLQMEGAIAVICNACLVAGRREKFACVGPPSENRRIAIAELTEPFDHDVTKHPGEKAPEASG